MANFRFRAAVALELRRKQESEAAAARSRAATAFSEARARQARAELARREAQAAELEAQRQGSANLQFEWHRNWITSLAARADQARAASVAQAAGLKEAEKAWYDARRRVLTLERMRERAWRRYQAEEQRQELKVINELAILRVGMSDTWRDET